MTSPWVGDSGNSPAGPHLSRRQVSATIRRSLISVAINGFLEGLDADAVHDGDEALGVAVAAGEVAVDEFLDDVRHLRARERRADDLAERRADAGLHFALVAADLDLVPLLAALVDAENADVAYVMVPTGVHAARDVDVDLADVVQIVQVVKALLDRFSDRDRLGVRERAEVAARTADDVRQQSDIGSRESHRPELAPERVELRDLYVCEDQVLLVRNAQLAE